MCILSFLKWVASKSIPFLPTKQSSWKIGGIKIIRGQLFLIWNTFGSSPSFLRVLDIQHLLSTARTAQRISSTATAPIDFDELESKDLHFELPVGYTPCGRVQLPSLCYFHWKEEQERFDQLTVEVPAMEQQSACYGCFVDRYAFTPRKSSCEPPKLNLISRSKVFPSPNPSYDGQMLSHFSPRSLSGCSIMLLRTYSPTLMERISWLDLTTIDESGADGNYLHGQPSSSIREVPSWLSLTPLHKCKVDYLSSAIIYTCDDQRWIKIAYPA